MFQLALLAAVLTMPQSPPIPDDLLTVAERSDYTATASSTEVNELIERIRSRSTIMRVSELGKTSQGKSIPLITLANPPFELQQSTGQATSVARPTRDPRPICFIMANIHAGEVEGKEACLMLAREIALSENHPWLKDLIIIIAPNYNADGNDEFDDVAKNRPGQIGPAHCGIRANAEGLDLNRDYMKLEAPETRALVKFLNDVDPDITIDCHTTDGSHHRYMLTYEAPLNPSGHPEPIDFVRNTLLPEVTRRVKQHTGYDMWHYGNFNRDHTIWETYSAQPRFGGPYQGLRNQMSILSEAYSYAPFKDRIIATREFVREILTYVAENNQKVIDINRRAREETARKGENPQPSDVVGIRYRIAAFNQPVIVKGYELAEGGEDGAAADPDMNLGAPKDYPVIHLGRFEATLSVSLPYAYIIPPGQPEIDAIIEKLKQHGIKVESFQGAAIVETYTVTRIHRAQRSFQNHRATDIDVVANRAQRDFPKGSAIVRTAQPLGTLAVYLLEPQSDDGLVTWNFFDSILKVGEPYPISRVQRRDDLPN